MKKKWIWMVPLGLLGMVLFAYLGGEIVMLLWNRILPPLFGWRTVTFWQALGLLVLCRILFGGWGGGSGGGKGRMRHRMRERWEKMTPEERERFRQGLRGCWDATSPPDSKTSP